MGMRIFYLVLTAAFAALGVYMALRIRGDAARMQGWATTTGTVLEKGAGKVVGTGPTHALHVKYAYAVNGKDYVSERVDATGNVGYLADDLHAQLAALPATVTVHYDPSNPSDAFLREAPKATFWLLVAVSAVLGLAVLVQALLLLTRAD